jgi:hypothetical protein
MHSPACNAGRWVTAACSRRHGSSGRIADSGRHAACQGWRTWSLTSFGSMVVCWLPNPMLQLGVATSRPLPMFVLLLLSAALQLLRVGSSRCC